MTRTNPKRASPLDVVQGHASKAELDHTFAKLQSIINLSKRSHSERRSTLMNIPALTKGREVFGDLPLAAKQTFNLPLKPKLGKRLEAYGLHGSPTGSLLNDLDIISNCGVDRSVMTPENCVAEQPPTTPQAVTECDTQRAELTDELTASPNIGACSIWPARPQEQIKICDDIKNCLNVLPVKKEQSPANELTPISPGRTMTMNVPRVVNGRVAKVRQSSQRLVTIAQSDQLSSCTESNIPLGNSAVGQSSLQSPLMANTSECVTKPSTAVFTGTVDPVEAKAVTFEQTPQITPDQLFSGEPALDNNRLVLNSLAGNWSKSILDELASEQQCVTRGSLWLGEIMPSENSLTSTSQHRYLKSGLGSRSELLLAPDYATHSASDSPPTSPIVPCSFGSPPRSPSSLSYSPVRCSYTDSICSSSVFTYSEMKDDDEDQIYEEPTQSSRIELDHEEFDQKDSKKAKDAGSGSDQNRNSPDTRDSMDVVSDQDANLPDAREPVDAGSDQEDYSHDSGSEYSWYSDEDNDDYPEYESDAPQSPDPDGADQDDSPERQAEDSDPEDGDSKDSEKPDDQDEDPNTFTDKSRASTLLSGMYELYQSGELCDITLLVDERQFRCHKNVLVVSSHYFKSMFTCNLAETSQREVRINSMSTVTMEAVLKYLYTGTVKLSQEIVQDMVSAADFLNLCELKLGCASYMQGHLENNNALGVYFFAEQTGCEDLQTEARNLIYRNFKDINDGEEFVALTAKNLKEILEWNLEGVHEIEVYEAAIKWLEHDPDKRRESVYEVFSNVRFAVIINRDRFFFFDKVMSNRLLTSDPNMKSLLDEIVQYSMLKERWVEYDFITSPRSEMVLSLIVFTAKKKPESTRLDTLAYYHDCYYKVPLLSQLPNNKISDMTILAANNRVFMLGGVKTSHDRTSLSSKMSTWCCESESYLDNSDTFMHKRKSFPFVQVDSDLFVVGGRDDSEVLPSVQVLKHTSVFVERSQERDLPKPLASSCAVGFGGNLYVFGGESYEIKRVRKSHHHISDNVYCLKPNRRSGWDPVGNMKQARAWAGCTVLNKKIYVIGGGYWDKKSKNKVPRALESVEIFDPRTKTWSDGPPLPVPLISPGVVKYLGTIYVLGGKYENAASNSVYFLDKDTNMWVQTHDLFESDKYLSLECVTDTSYTVVDMPCEYYRSPSTQRIDDHSSTGNYRDGVYSDSSDDNY